LSSAEIGEMAADRILTLHELSPVRGSLEDAFMELTHDAVEYRSGASTHVRAATNPKERK